MIMLYLSCFTLVLAERSFDYFQVYSRSNLFIVLAQSLLSSYQLITVSLLSKPNSLCR
jgi:hypothetical protein